MEAFYRKIYLFKAARVEPIKIAHASQLLIAVEFSDYTIPDGAKASAFAHGCMSNTIYTQPCAVDGNIVTFIPEHGFFVTGRNILQYQIDNGVINLAIDVYCEISLPDGGEATTPEQVLPYVTRAEAAAAQSESAAARAQEVKDSIPEDYTELDSSVKRLKDDLAYLAPSIVCNDSGTEISLDDGANRIFQGLRIYGKTTQDGTPTPDSPVELVSVGDAGTIDIIVFGKNMCSQVSYGAGLYASKGFLRKNDPVTSPYSAVAWGGVGIVIPVSENVTYTVSSDITPNKYFSITFYKDSDVSITASANAISFKEYANTNKATFTTPAGCRYAVITAVNNVASEFTWSFWQVEHGSSATEYEPYIGQTITLQTPNGLPGIPVDSGGNYTDADGKQWICDEVDFARGVYVQRIGRIDGYNGESVGDIYLSSTGGLDTGANVLYPLAEPIETALSDEELAAYAALHTNKPNTTIYNDAGAYMDVEYVADTKLYIDKKINELATAIVSGT